MEVKKNQLAQEIDIDNNPVVDKDIIPEENKDITEEETISTSTTTPISTRMEYIEEEEINPIEQNNTVEEIPEPTLEPVIERPKNTVRYIDSGFTF